MERRNCVSKKQTQKIKQDGFSSLMDSYIFALEDNTEIITEMLEELSKRELSEEDKKELKSINRGIESLDNQLKRLGK